MKATDWETICTRNREISRNWRKYTNTHTHTKTTKRRKYEIKINLKFKAKSDRIACEGNHQRKKWSAHVTKSILEIYLSWNMKRHRHHSTEMIELNSNTKISVCVRLCMTDWAVCVCVLYTRGNWTFYRPVKRRNSHRVYWSAELVTRLIYMENV